MEGQRWLPVCARRTCDQESALNDIHVEEERRISRMETLRAEDETRRCPCMYIGHLIPPRSWIDPRLMEN